MYKNIKVGLAQIQSGLDKGQNIEQVTKAIKQAADQKVDILVFPEASQISFAAKLVDAAEPLDGPFATLIREKSVEYDMFIVAGMFEPASDGRIYNTLLATGKGVDAQYHKVHLYDAFGSKESDTVKPGSAYLTIDTPFGKIGFAICYDLRFADQFTALGKAGAELVIVSASWGDGPSKAEHWDLLIRARAADAQAWLLACDQAWQAPQGSAPLGIGRSSVVDPTGCIRARLDAGPGLLITEINLSNVKNIRERIPILAMND